MSTSLAIGRREFLKAGSLFGGGLLIGFFLPSAASGQERKQAAFIPNAYLQIGADGSLTIICSPAEMGQGTYTAMAQILAEELDADWSKINVIAAPMDMEKYGHPIFHIQMTGGSTSTFAEYDRMRQAGATAKALLIAAAAKTWNADATKLTTADGIVTDPATGKKLSYGDLAITASTLPMPKDVKLKDRKDFKLISKPVKRVDTIEKTNGNLKFGIDVTLPGMLVALIARSPVIHGKMTGFNPEKALAVPGVKFVVPTSSGVAVVATGFWPAKKGIAALEVTWDEGTLASFDTAKQMEAYAKIAGDPGLIAAKKGDIASVKNPAKEFSVDYQFPYLAHTPMEPLNCVADVKDDGVDLYLGSQGQTIDQMAVAGVLKLNPTQVRLHNHTMGGAFGRRCMLDAHLVVETVLISKAVKAPVKVIWTRADDIKGAYYLTSSYHRLKTSLGQDGNPLSWQVHMITQSHLFGTSFEAAMIKNGVDYFAIDGGIEIFYDVPNFQAEWTRSMDTIPTLWLRSNSHMFNGYVKETMIDVLAKSAGKDPLQYRLGLLTKNEKHTNLLKVVAEKSGWGKPLPAGHAHGIAIHEAFKSTVAMVAEVSLDDHGAIKVHKITAAIDCGLAINPANVEAQIQGSVAFGMTIAFYGKIDIDQGRPRQSNFHDYKIARMFEVPPVDVTIVESTQEIGGVGEACVPTVAPAIANAAFVLTGNHMTRLPFPADVRKA